MRRVAAFIVCLVAGWSTAAGAQSRGCSIPLQPISDTEQELLLDPVRAKLDSGNRLLKMKLLGAFDTEVWTAVSMEAGPATITGFTIAGEERIVLAQLVGIQGEGKDSLEWALFMRDRAPRARPAGTAYFMRRGELVCVSLSLEGWLASLEETFGTGFTDSAELQIPDSAVVLEHFGLK